jgi:hypothetical protein
VRPQLAAATSRLEGASSRLVAGRLVEGVNETYLMHGTRPETVLAGAAARSALARGAPCRAHARAAAAVVRSGLNERFSGGHFGAGSYLAEVADKINQYVVKESKCNAAAVAELHGRLYADGGARPAGNVYYGFVVRATLGHFVRTKDGATSLDGAGGRQGHPIFAKGTSRRELAPIPDSPPGTMYHSMLVEIGGKVKRHREFVVFHSDRIYPEYLLAFNRA